MLVKYFLPSLNMTDSPQNIQEFQKLLQDALKDKLHPDGTYHMTVDLMESLVHQLLRLKEYEIDNEKMTEALKTFPEKLRSSLEGHTGQAHRITTQLCEEVLSSLSIHD